MARGQPPDLLITGGVAQPIQTKAGNRPRVGPKQGLAGLQPLAGLMGRGQPRGPLITGEVAQPIQTKAGNRPRVGPKQGSAGLQPLVGLMDQRQPADPHTMVVPPKARLPARTALYRKRDDGRVIVLRPEGGSCQKV